MTQSQIAYRCKDLVFHFNKKHLEDQTIPMWVVKAHGQTFYVDHVTADMPWSTKETPDNPSTKGSIKFKQCKLVIDDDNCATISKLGLLDRSLPTPHPPTVRVLARYDSDFHRALLNREYPHSAVKEVIGACYTSYIVCDMEEQYVILAILKYTDLRILAVNEYLYKAYDTSGKYIDEDYYDDELEDE